MGRIGGDRIIALGVIVGLVACAAVSPAGAFDRGKYEKAIKQKVQKMNRGARQGPFQPEWESLKKHDEAPDWFRNAKIGIYFHWGVYSVPAFGSEWYPRNMHRKGSGVNKHHIKTYGDPSEYGYHEFVPQFDATHFDAEEWAELFRKAGAQYAGPVSEHHDGYSMWDSEVTPWNAADTGPKRDITGELEEAIKGEGLKFVTTFHHARTKYWYPRVEGWPTTSDDPKLQMLYMNVPELLFNRIWQAKLGEVIDQYQPDLIWFDGALEHIPGEYHRNFLAYYFNHAADLGKDVVVTCKGHDFSPDIAVEDFEKGRADELTEYVWLTDDTISYGSWCYTEDLRIKSTTKVLHDFIDIVSKNGCLLLNISPKSDGTIPDIQRNVLLGIGEWLDKNGEAIYNTRPWLTFGEGPTRLKKGGGFVGHVQYGPQDVRFTRSKDGKAIYAITLGWPVSGELVLDSVKVDDTDGGQVEILGLDRPVQYSVNEADQLVIDVPEVKQSQRPCKHAYVFKLTGFETSLHPMATIGSEAFTLKADEALLVGPGIDTEEKTDTPNIGYWDDPSAQAHWLMNLSKPGTYRIDAVVATTSESNLAVDVIPPRGSGQDVRTVSTDVPRTGSWTKQQAVTLGKVKVTEPGIYHVVARPANENAWEAINLWRVQFRPLSLE